MMFNRALPKLIICLFLGIMSLQAHAQSQEPPADNARIFFDKLKALCGKSFGGKLADGMQNDDFSGKELVMEVKGCETDRLIVPFYVGDDRSRNWIITYKDGKLELKHDHRLENGNSDPVTMYGGTSPNGGFAQMQFFPADQETADLIAYASTNVWWITLTDTKFTYNLRRIGSDRYISVEFDLTQQIPNPEAPWGWDRVVKGNEY